VFLLAFGSLSSATYYCMSVRICFLLLLTTTRMSLKVVRRDVQAKVRRRITSGGRPAGLRDIHCPTLRRECARAAPVGALPLFSRQPASLSSLPGRSMYETELAQQLSLSVVCRLGRPWRTVLYSHSSEFKLAVLAGSSTPDSTDLRQRPADYFFRDVKEYRVLDSYLYRLVC